MITNENDGYDAADNGARCYTLAIRMIRLERIRAGLSEPNPDDAEEVEAARVAIERAQ